VAKLDDHPTNRIQINISIFLSQLSQPTKLRQPTKVRVKMTHQRYFWDRPQHESVFEEKSSLHNGSEDEDTHTHTHTQNIV